MVQRRALAAAVAILALAASCESASPDPTSPQPTSSPAAAAPGTPGWQITHPGPEHSIEGFADRISVKPDEPVRLFVSTTAHNFTVTAFRMGNYTGSDAVQIWKSDPHNGRVQPNFTVQKPTSTVIAPWDPALTVDTTGWAAGDYLFRLDGDNGSQQFVPLTVRTPSNEGRIVIVNAVTTWQAYNRWGGYSLYDSPSGKKALRSRAVSFDRPYQADTMQGAGDFLYFELPMVLFAERSGHQIGYATDADLDADPHLLDGASAVITLAHDEYWSANMRNNLVKARDRGVNLAFLGGNEGYRHMRFDSTTLGPNRLEIDYKSFNEDPLSKTNPALATQEWRSPPNPHPESALLGNYYKCNPVDADLVAADTTNWLLQGILSDGQHLPRMVGNEYNQVDLAVPTPRPIQVLFHSPLTCNGNPGYADVSYYTTPRGAAVFAAGTEYWICGLDPRCERANTAGDTTRNAITAITARLLDAYAAGPAGTAHPAIDNLAKLNIPGATSTASPYQPDALVPN
ncbi:hypothetical protein FGL95_26800 [Nocardiaceae bacterium YC2-7]|uniref:N,N-dimethylformamidase beta subunit-like C-terminal domain-containing protein n=1 Tax=Antrihabitans stalactiti TaxID=2584121 RepID=A0A848KSW4_9NOCA|nr:N,N-dimethylformamidase beta subunit family domain-containing protein [Antrihabitans stalactiti]NMN98647.1 hypothetical protein [Antrihabitans stalactiti]